jgi:beta-glucosidase
LFGYRWYDYYSQEPAFPFGHGLSYSEFEYQNLHVNGRNVSIDITNKSTSRFKNESKLRTGKEVVQLYLGFPSIVTGTPPKQLKGFEKISLLPQETKTVVFTLRDRDLSIWDVETHGWRFM